MRGWQMSVLCAVCGGVGMGVGAVVGTGVGAFVGIGVGIDVGIGRGRAGRQEAIVRVNN